MKGPRHAGGDVGQQLKVIFEGCYSLRRRPEKIHFRQRAISKMIHGPARPPPLLCFSRPSAWV